jgi:hypothetical protein
MIHHDPWATPNDVPQPIIAPMNADSGKPGGHALDWICITSPNHRIAVELNEDIAAECFSRRSRVLLAEKDGKVLSFDSITQAAKYFGTDAANLSRPLRHKDSHTRMDGWKIYFKEAK